ncbi:MULTISPECIES: tripartite tricarboxylate transporter permease [unclassified Haladaptatus]|uniref:tripartite tricarboxylate transporter permease n=1 Tax=unclassified Haladaptatus TaxID=2622732 RepID=UPI002FCE06C9
MVTTGAIIEALGLVLNPQLLLVIFGISILGIILGALPGVGPTLAMALFFPFTFALDPVTGLVIMAVIYGSATYGGSISAILVNVPGTPGSAATLLDGYPMTRAGQGAVAIGISTMASFGGAVVGLILLAFFAPVLADISLLFGPPEFFWLAILGLSTVSAVSGDSLLKALAAMSLGIFFATIGVDPIRAQPRFVFDTFYLQGGINLIVLLVGLFAISQSIELALESNEDATDASSQMQGNVWDGVKLAISDWFGLIRGGVIGTVVGAIPGLGISAANFLSYLTAVNLSSHPETFGTGEPKGVVAAESANNGSAMGALIPAMALAIPGGAAAAVFIGVMLTYGITPGPNVFETTLPYVVFIAILLGDIVMLFVGLFGAKYIARVTSLPNDVILTSIVVFALIGSFTVRNNILDVGMALFFGLFGFLLARRGYSLISFILGFILAPIAERGFQRALLISSGDYGIFFASPIDILLILLSVTFLLSPILLRLRSDSNAA